MSDEEDGNVVNLHLSQNGQDEKVGGQISSKDQNERKRKRPNESFSDHENNSSSEKDIRKSKSKKKKKKKSSKEHKRNKWKRSGYSSTSSSSSSSTSSFDSQSSSDDDDERSKPKSKKHKTSKLDEVMFHVQTEEEKHEYNLPKKLLKYTDHYLKKFIAFKVPSLNTFIRDNMKEERRNHELKMGSVLEKVQGKTKDVFGPLSRVWTYLQEVTSSDHEDEDESIQVDLDLLLTHIKKTVLILLQALNTMTYHRFNVLFVIMAKAGAKYILKEKADILGVKDCLLGKDFQNQVVKDTEAKAKMHNAVRRKKKGAKAQPQASTTLQIPFQESPSRQQEYRGNGGGHRTTCKFVYRKKGDTLKRSV